MEDTEFRYELTADIGFLITGTTVGSCRGESIVLIPADVRRQLTSAPHFQQPFCQVQPGEGEGLVKGWV